MRLLRVGDLDDDSAVADHADHAPAVDRQDRTLNSDGRRSTPIPVFHCAEWAHPQPGYAHDHIYQLGRAPSKKEVSA